MRKLNKIDKAGLVLVAIFSVIVLVWYQFLWPALVLVALSYIPVKGK
jgi:cell division septal protein FtsQ